MENLEEKWEEVRTALKRRFGRDADVKSALFVIGLREWGQKKKKLTKEQKQDLMNLAACKVLSLEGYFSVRHLDAEGWPVWEQSKALPNMNAKEQESFLKEHIVIYFEQEKLL